MKTTSVTFMNPVRRCRSSLAALTLIAFAALGNAQNAQAAANPITTQTAEVHALLTAVHELTSYNGNDQTAIDHLASWQQLWAEDATFIVNGTASFVGRNAIMAFFAGSAFFNNDWIGLTPSFRTKVEIHGDTAEVYLECIFLNSSDVVMAKRSFSGTVRKSGGKWLFWRMASNPALPLFP
jgi:hypothetical protein